MENTFQESDLMTLVHMLSQLSIHVCKYDDNTYRTRLEKIGHWTDVCIGFMFGILTDYWKLCIFS